MDGVVADILEEGDEEEDEEEAEEGVAGDERVVWLR